MRYVLTFQFKPVKEAKREKPMSTPKQKFPVNKWPWKAIGTPPAVKTPMSMKTKATIQAPLMVLVGYLIYRWTGHLIGPAIVWTLAGVVLVGGWFVPPIFHGIEKFGMGLAKYVTVGLNYGLLVPFFYLCFLPGRLILKLQGIDPMDRTFPDNRPSFWIPRKPVPDMSQYRKQH
jgi:hypothetical protein